MNHQRFLQLVCLLTLWTLTLSGCATTPPVVFYTLSPDRSAPRTADGPSSEEVAIRVGPVTFPEFLERPQIVVRTTSNRIDVDEFHRWGGSLQEDFSRILAQNLSSLLATNRVHASSSRGQPETTYRLALDVQQFDGRLGEGVTLNVVWTFVDERSTAVRLIRRFEFTAPATTPDYEGLVAAHSTALAALCRDIAAEIGRLEGRGRR